MKYIYNKIDYIKILESIKVTIDQLIWIIHPITEDLIKVNIKSLTRNNVIVSVLEDSYYFGQPDFEIKKTSIIGIV